MGGGVELRPWVGVYRRGHRCRGEAIRGVCSVVAVSGDVG